MKVGTIHPGITLEEIRKSTGFELLVPEGISETLPPTEEEINILRNKVDPLGIRKLEVLTGNEREELLNIIIEKELAMENRFPKLIS